MRPPEMPPEAHSGEQSAADYDEYRPLMFSIAHRMTGCVGDAEDIVQDAFVRLTRALRDGARIDSPKAYLATVTTRLAISHLRSARVRREAYVGAWLPEPLVVTERGPYDDPAERAEMSDSLSMAFLVLLESLSPTERAVFLLHEVFGYDYAEIAEIIGKSEANCRQISVRARRHIDAGRPRFDASREQRDEVARRFFDAASGGDLGALLSLLAPDVVTIGDGGGKGRALRESLHGPERVARFMVGLFRRAQREGTYGVPGLGQRPAGRGGLRRRRSGGRRVRARHRRRPGAGVPRRDQPGQAHPPRPDLRPLPAAGPGLTLAVMPTGFTEDTAADTVVESFAATPDPRLRELLSSLVRHLHAFVRETEPTIAEWDQAIEFLTATGQKMRP